MPIEEFVDDADAIPDDTLLYRRVDWDKVGGAERCEAGVEARLSGNCFRDFPQAKAESMGFPGPCMSVGAANQIPEGASHEGLLLAEHPGYGLAAVSAGQLRALKRFDGTDCPQGVMLSPTDIEPWHAVVFDQSGNLRKEGVCKAIALAAHWVVPLIGGGAPA